MAREALSLSSTDGLTETQIILRTTKEAVWPKPDYETMVANGTEPLAAALVKIIRDRLPKAPVPATEVTASQSCLNFIEVLTVVKDNLTTVRRADDVKLAIQRIKAVYTEPGSEGLKLRSPLGLKYRSIYRRDPLYVDMDDLAKARQMVRNGFPAPAPVYARHFEVRSLKTGSAIFRKSDNKLIQGEFPDNQSALQWLAENHESHMLEKTEAQKKKMPLDRPHLATLIRSGNSVRNPDRDITPQDFINIFGFKAVQFGEWLPDAERQTVLNMAHDALMDLAEVINCEPAAISLHGELSAAFGARGKGGRTSAHFEPYDRIFNLTRLTGAGGLAHEWGHALDCMIGDGSTYPLREGLPSAMGGTAEIDKCHIPEILGHLPDDIGAAMLRVADAFERKPKTAERRLHEISVALPGRLRDLNDAMQTLQTMEALPDQKGKKIQVNRAAKTVEDKQLAVKRLEAEKAAIETKSPDDVLGFRMTDFFSTAQSLDRTRAKPYFTLRREMFARCFEACVFDLLEAKNARSDYLVHSVGENSYPPEIYEKNPYAAGDERKFLNDAMVSMIEKIGPWLTSDPTLTRKPR